MDHVRHVHEDNQHVCSWGGWVGGVSTLDLILTSCEEAELTTRES